MSLLDKIGPVLSRFDELNSLMAEASQSDVFIKLSKEYSDLKPIVEVALEYKKACEGLVDAEEMLSDPDMADMAYDEVGILREEIPKLEHRLKLALLPKDEADERNAIIEIRAGTGGDEAALFAADLFNMYKGYAALRGWRMEIIELSENDLGGFKEVIAEIGGTNVYAELKFESGGHRVQRVPVTEGGGRIHTSAATVAVLPEAQDVDIDLDEKDIRVDVYRAQGAGGQHVNKTESAVRLTHMPSGIVVAIQDEKSQHKNRARAMQILKSRLYDMERMRLANERSADRKSQIGSGDRSERVRTYNFPQARVTDHRINLTTYQLEHVLSGAGLEEFIIALRSEEQAEKLSSIGLA